MPSLSDTITRLSAMRGVGTINGGQAPKGRLSELESFGSNPGDLNAKIFVPDQRANVSALVVVLHGCTQTAADYDLGSGWSHLADKHGFALLFPEQQRRNNANLCFNWFLPEDSRRGAGEALSIRQMIAAMVERYHLDSSRIFITGLSAGGGMASIMLATYPEVFAGGAIIAGLPYGCAGTIPQAFDRMRGQGVPGEAELARLVRQASDHSGPWPTISVWHGSADATVNPRNADAIINQWRSLHGAEADARIEAVDGYPRQVWRDDQGRDVIEAYSITGMGHGIPLDTSGDDGCGRSGAYMLEAAISSTHHICRFWGLIEDDREIGNAPRSSVPNRALVPSIKPTKTSDGSAGYGQPKWLNREGPRGGMADVGKVIEDALRAAGLMR